MGKGTREGTGYNRWEKVLEMGQDNKNSGYYWAYCSTTIFPFSVQETTDETG